jgi:hypothetical protein
MGTSLPPPGNGGSDPEDPGPTYGSLPKYEGPASDGGSPDPRLSGPLGVFATVRTALDLYGADFRRLWAAVALIVIPVELLVFVLRAVTVPSGSILQNSKIYVPADSGRFVAISLLSELLAGLALLVSVGATYRILLGRRLHHPADLLTSFSFALDRVVPLLWVSILTGVLVAFGLIAVIIGAIYLFVSFVVAVPVLMAEDRRGLTALSRSRELVSENWWHVLGCVIVAAIVALIGEIVINQVADAIVSGSHSITGFLLVNALISALVSILFYPFTAAVPVVLYVDLLLRKSDPQLERLLD